MKLDKKYIKPLVMIVTLGVTFTTIYYGGRYIKKRFFNKKEEEQSNESNEIINK